MSRLSRFIRIRIVTSLVVLLVSTQDSVSARTLTKGTTSRAARADAINSIPLGDMNEHTRLRISSVIERPSMFRRMPIKLIECDPNMYVFMIRHPEVIVNIWELMKITKVSVRRTGAYTLWTSDGVGTQCSVELVYGSKDTHIFLCEGHYEGPLFRSKVNGRCVLVLKSAYDRLANQRDYVTNRLDVFLQFDHVGADVLTRTLHPLIGRSADMNFVESAGFLQRISTTSKRNGPAMQRLTSRLTHVDASIRDRFAEFVVNVANQAPSRLATRPERQEQQTK